MRLHGTSDTLTVQSWQSGAANQIEVFRAQDGSTLLNTQVNQLIHQKIVEASRNATLLATYANFAGRIRRIRYSANFARKRERWGEAMREHEMILEALRRRAGSELSDILFHHLRNKRTAAIEHLSEVDQTAKSAKPALSETASDR